MTKKVLLLAIGNPGRGDDGLGPALAEALTRLEIPNLTIDADYQLTVEDSAAIAEHEIVIFADADAAGPEPYSLRTVKPIKTLEFSSHGVEPRTLLGLAEQIFGCSTKAYVLGIRGYKFDQFVENLSDKANSNLNLTLQFIEPLLRKASFEAAVCST